ncbi:MAG TPA: hypothetical protein PLK59_08130 [Synergistales bacterium]|nr:hypothetical protein [Synergistales bacterium]HRW87931.1 hypothetical protein [Thermovirgaceae bacterium]MDD3133390.1 hypothetical protein [Synergistales bacterium]MDD3830429.1 hypothetical protein [Synergistales bacterium]MDD4023586.1 hypothetical protein [Synergistales bacterium]
MGVRSLDGSFLEAGAPFDADARPATAGSAGPRAAEAPGPGTDRIKTTRQVRQGG